jgi:hypothetical protein
MTIRPDTDLGRRAETHLATITAAGNFILFHASHRKLGMSDRNRDNLLVGESPKHVQEIIADNLSNAGFSWGCCSAIDSNGRTIWIADAHRGDEKRFLAHAEEKLTAFVELDAAIRAPLGFRKSDNLRFQFPLGFALGHPLLNRFVD